jgi:hypothetical protein
MIPPESLQGIPLSNVVDHTTYIPRFERPTALWDDLPEASSVCPVFLKPFLTTLHLFRSQSVPNPTQEAVVANLNVLLQLLQISGKTVTHFVPWPRLWATLGEWYLVWAPCRLACYTFSWASFNHVFFVRFRALVATNMKMTAFWDVALCSFVDVDRRFRGAYCLHHQGDDGGSTHL